jgi:hypothetical protein
MKQATITITAQERVTHDQFVELATAINTRLQYEAQRFFPDGALRVEFVIAPPKEQ